MRRGALVTMLLLVITLVSVYGCETEPSAETMKLRVGVLPIVDALPLYVAEQEGLFTEENLEVEVVVFPSALERDSALQAGQLDGVLNDLVSAVLLNKDGGKVLVVRLAYRGNAEQAMMSILVSPNSKVESAADLRGVPIAVSKNTVIEFSTDTMLRQVGLSKEEVIKTEVTKIPVRVEMLTQSQIEAATLPEPFASLAVLQGARVLVDDRQSGIGQSVLTFGRELAVERPEAVTRLLRAYERAVEKINASPGDYRSLMVDKAKVPEPLRDSLPVPPFPRAQVPTQREVEAVVSWMLERRLIEAPVEYRAVVTDGLLPEGR